MTSAAAFPGAAGADDARRRADEAECRVEDGDGWDDEVWADEDWDDEVRDDEDWEDEDWGGDHRDGGDWGGERWAPGGAASEKRSPPVGDLVDDGRSELPYRVACFAHPGQLTSVHCRGCGRPICWECDVTTSQSGRKPHLSGPLCSACGTDQPKSAPRSQRTAPSVIAGRYRLTPAVAGLVMINVAVFAATAAHASWEIDLAQSPSGIAAGQVYRLVTAVFVHAGFTHLLFNMVALLVVGPPVEAALGKVRFSALYLLAGVVGFGFSFLLGPVNGLSVGASGAILGVFGAWYSLARAKHKDTAAFALLLILLLVYSFYDPAVDWRAHVGGLATGLAGGAMVAWTARRPQRRPQRRAVPELAAVSAVVGVLAAMVLVRAAQIRH
ncbi:MAG: rhomboid family intramembrane serine protease [Acidimicrobiales bacterium]